METTSFISTKVATKLLKALTQVLKNSVDKRNKELVRINDVFGNCEELAKFYIQPDCQQVNPADELEDETISSIRAGVFETINKFFNRDIVTRDGASQMFILADAGMGKTSLLMMVKLSHLMAFWPKNYECKLLKLGATTLSDIDKIENKSQTVLLLDSLDEDTQCKQGGTIERLTKILEATSCFYRVVITCRTQFFPETAGSAFNTMGKISFNNYDCPLVYLSLFTDEQVDAYLDKRYPRSLKYLFNQFYNPKLHDAKQSIRSIGSLQFRPFLLSHVETLLESHRQGATEYELYKGLVDTWLNREIIKLRKYHDKKINKEDLLKACIWLAETMQRQGTHTVALKHIQQLCHCESHIILLNDSADRVIEGIDHIDIGTNSLLNRNSYGEFRFSHLSIREFLIVYGVELGILVDREDPFHKTDNMLKFIKTVNKYKVGLFSNEKNGYLLTGLKLLEGSQLSGFDLTYASLEQSDLRKAVLNGIKLEGANLQGANLDGANLERANLKGANLQGASLQGANLQGANLQDASLHKAHLNGAILDNANLNCATLTGAQLTILKSSQDNITTLKNADLRMADLSEANLEGADLTKVCLTSAKLQASLCSRTNFTKASLDSADFKSSIFINANFEKADLTQADFGGCDFTNANLQGAELSGCDLTQARLTSSNITDSQRGVAIFRKYKNEKRNELVE
ncbi:pentapeptide repeat-containing protein [Vibrio ordalii]|uniref:pentapeptide repeat-containing protein n=1 Tax=Vibrio ordalii TaxID=28174 RepID=UPI002577CD04|nr:pentapeptide repeat-containing protein [Vibrio ordalii]MCS0351030.1 pentapeptide repeat-containing protein [Vibrio ordalii]